MADTLNDRKPWYMELHWQVLIALVMAIVLGLVPYLLKRFFGVEAAAETVRGFIIHIGFLGDLFLRLLKMIIIPLIFTSLVSGVAGLGDAGALGRLGIRTLVYYTLTTTAAIGVGLTLVNLIRPGVGLTLGAGVDLGEEFTTAGFSLKDFFLRLVPDNPIDSMARGDVLPVITFAVLFGVFLARSDGEAAASVKRVVNGVLDVIQALTLAIVRLAPVGIFALLAPVVARSGLRAILDLKWYFVTVGAGLAIHFCITLPVLLFLFGRRSPFEYFGDVAPAVATAFSTASSSATLPLSMECAEHEAKLPKSVVSFVLPLGATVNMDGTALYEAVAALTIAQMYGVELGFGQQVLVLLTALLASVGAAGIPMAGLVMLVVVLQAVGLPLEGIGTIIAVDRILDMMRTSTNVWSDLVGTAVITRFEGRAT